MGFDEEVYFDFLLSSIPLSEAEVHETKKGYEEAMIRFEIEYSNFIDYPMSSHHLNEAARYYEKCYVETKNRFEVDYSSSIDRFLGLFSQVKVDVECCEDGRSMSLDYPMNSHHLNEVAKYYEKCCVETKSRFGVGCSNFPLGLLLLLEAVTVEPMTLFGAERSNFLG